MKIDFKKYLPHIIAIVGFAIISLIYFNPILKGKVLQQGDMINSYGMSKTIKDFNAKNDENTLWTNAMFGGMPAYLIVMETPGNLVKEVYRFIRDIFPYPISMMFLSMLCFYILMMVMKIDPLPASIGSFAYAFSSYFIIIAVVGHITKSYAMAFMPLVAAGYLLTFKGKYYKGAVLFMIAFAFEICANHPQITYYLLLTLLLLTLVYFVKYFREKKLKFFFKPVLFLAIASVLAVIPNVQSLLTVNQFTHYTIRGQSNLTSTKTENEAKSGLTPDYITQWSYGIDETFSLMIPDVNGGASGAIGQNNPKALKNVDPQFKRYIGQSDEYWGDQPFTAGPVYFGAVIMFLFILGLFVLKGYYKVWLVVATILSILLSWGHNFMFFTDLFINYFPLYDKFRAVTMILVIAQLCVPIMVALTLKKIIDERAYIEKNIKKFYWGTAVAAGICILYLLIPSLFTDFFKDGEFQKLTAQLQQAKFPTDQISLFLNNLKEARESILSSDALRSLVFILISAGLVWAYIKGKIKVKFLLTGILILTVVDLWQVDRRYVNKSHYTYKTDKEHPSSPTQADLQIMQDSSKDYRVFNLSVSTFNDANTSIYHQSIGGYNGAKLMRYQELIDHHLSGQNTNMKVLDMLNTKYFIVQGKDKKPVAQRNPDALGNVWFVDNYRLVANADSAITALNNFQPSKEAIINKKFKNDLKEFDPTTIDSAAQIKLTSFKQNELVYNYNSTTAQLTIFSEIYYPKGWHVYIDDKPAQYFRANYVLRAMVLPAGKHQITFKFHPKIYYLGGKISYIGSALFFAAILALLFFLYKEKKKKKSEALETNS